MFLTGSPLKCSQSRLSRPCKITRKLNAALKWKKSNAYLIRTIKYNKRFCSRSTFQELLVLMGLWKGTYRWKEQFLCDWYEYRCCPWASPRIHEQKQYMTGVPLYSKRTLFVTLRKCSFIPRNLFGGWPVKNYINYHASEGGGKRAARLAGILARSCQVVGGLIQTGYSRS